MHQPVALKFRDREASGDLSCQWAWRLGSRAMSARGGSAHNTICEPSPGLARFTSRVRPSSASRYLCPVTHCTGDRPAATAKKQSSTLEVAKLPDAKRLRAASAALGGGMLVCPATRFHRSVKDHDGYAGTLAICTLSPAT